MEERRKRKNEGEGKLSKKARSLGSSSLSCSSAQMEWPLATEFVCPISCRLISDPAVVRGRLVEHSCFLACKELNYHPSFLPQRYFVLAFMEATPVDSLKSTIFSWCDSVGRSRPLPISPQQALNIVRRLQGGGEIGTQESATAEQSSQSRTDNVQQTPPPPPTAALAARSADPFKTEILTNLLKPEMGPKESALSSLIQQAESGEGQAVSLCSPDILAAILPLLLSTLKPMQILACKAMKIFSSAAANIKKIIDCQAIPALLFALCGSAGREHAAAAVVDLTRDGALWPETGPLSEAEMKRLVTIVYKDCAETFIERKAAAFAILNVTHSSDHSFARFETVVTVRRLVSIAEEMSDGDSLEECRLALELINLVSRSRKLKTYLIRPGAISLMFRLAKNSNFACKQCMDVLYNLCSDFPTEFRMQALAADGITVLDLMMDEWEEQGKQMAKTMLAVLKEEEKEQK